MRFLQFNKYREEHVSLYYKGREKEEQGLLKSLL